MTPLLTVFLLLATLIALVLGGQAESWLYHDAALERALLAPPPISSCEKETPL